MKFRIKSPSRLHFSLIDLNGHLGRVDGGIGIGLDNPNTLIEFSNEVEQGIVINASRSLIPAIQHVIESFRVKFELEFPNLSITVLEIIPEHVGLGSKTQFLLAIGKGLAHIKSLDISISELTQLVHRGGTSGVGYQVFEMGGFVTDLGHTFGIDSEKKDFLPSSVSSAPPALPFYGSSIPDSWNVLLVSLNVPQGANCDQEVSVFQSKCPILLRDVEQISHKLLYQVIPAFMKSDLPLLAKGLHFINTHGFKKEEILLQDLFLQKLLTKLWKKFQLPVGMSSFGPTIFILCNKGAQTQRVSKYIQDLISQDPASPGGKVTKVNPTNTGYEIIPIE